MVAYDNFDLFVNTLTGKDTLHDTIGIAVQNITSEGTGIEDALMLPSEYDEPGNFDVRKHRRGTFIARDVDVDVEKPTMSKNALLELGDARRKLIP